MKIISDSTGADIEVYTAEELEAQKTAALEEFKNTEYEGARSALAKAEEELAKLKDKDLNFGNVRKQKEAAEKKVEELKNEIDTKIATAKKEVLDTVTLDYKNETIATLAGGDDELKKKIEFHYNRLNDPAGTKEEIAKKLTDAYALATKVESTGALNSTVISSGGVSRINIKAKGNYTPEEKAFAHKLAQSGGLSLTEEDFK